jgi:hypothetical protein
MKFLKKLKEDFENNEKLQMFLQIIFFCLAIVSIVTSVEAFNLLKMASGDVNNILDNWRRVPITDFEVIGFNESCSSGFNLVDMQPLYPGSKLGGCACKDGASYNNATLYSSYDSCGSDKPEPECYQDPKTPSVVLESYHGSKLCIKREGEALVSWENGYEARPNPKRVKHPPSSSSSSLYTCPTGYQMCGEGSLDANRSICFPTTAPCPLTSLEESVTPGNASSSTSFAFKAPHAGYMVGRTEQAMKLPIVDINFAFVGSSRGVCYGTKQNSQGTYDGKGRWSTMSSYSNDYPTKCEKSDTRYEVVTEWQESEFLEHNFWKRKECVNVTSNPNYHETSVPCYSSGYSCEMTTDSSFSCGSSDTTCLSLLAQTECGKFMEAARSLTERWGLHVRTQIYWKEDCEKDFASIKDNRGPLQQAVGTQYTLLIINTIANAFAIFIAVTLFLNLAGVDVPWIPYSGEKERELVKKLKVKVVPLLRIAKVVPLFIGVMIMLRVRFFFASLGQVDCSDSLTNYTFQFLGEQIPKVFLMNVITLAIEGIQLLVPILLVVKERYFDSDASKVQPEEEETEKETELVRLPSQREQEASSDQEGYVIGVERHLLSISRED